MDSSNDQRLRLIEDRSGDLAVIAHFDGVEQAISESLKSSQPVVLFGDNIHEEIVSYRRSNTTYEPLLFTGSHVDSVSDLVSFYYVGRKALLRRIASFLSSAADPSLIDFSALQSGKVELIGHHFIYDFIAERYIRTRKRDAESAPQEIAEFLSILESQTIEEPIVISHYGYGWTYSHLLALDIRDRSANFVPLVIAVDTKFMGNASFAVERRPIQQEEAFRFLSDSLPMRHAEVVSRYSLFNATQSRSRSRSRERNSDSRTSISLFDVSSFANFLRNLGSEDVSLDSVAAVIPRRVVAPVMFEDSDTGIGLDHSGVYGTSASQINGSARALNNQIYELITLGSLDNSIPRITNVLRRMSNILVRVTSGRIAEEADVVEFGVEFSYFESRIYEADDRLGSLSRGEVLGFLGEGKKFLSRFEAWRTYSEETDTPQTAATLDNASAAIQILRLAVAEGVISLEASARVEIALEADNDGNSNVWGEGYVKSGENLGAALGRGALKAAKEVGEGALGGATEAASEISRSFMRRHAEVFMRLAASRSERWLAMLLDYLSDHT